MNFENPIFIILFSTGIIFVISGYLLKLKPPRDINYIYGYRTKSSMKSIDRWNFAQTYSGKKMIVAGLGMSIFGCIALILNISQTAPMIIACVVVIIISCAIPVILTERALRKKFG